MQNLSFYMGLETQKEQAKVHKRMHMHAVKGVCVCLHAHYIKSSRTLIFIYMPEPQPANYASVVLEQNLAVYEILKPFR